MVRPARYTVAVDFDGVLHRYDSPWVAPHVIPDGPVDGAIEWLHGVIQAFDVVIHSTRCKTWRGRRAVRRWLRQNAGGLWHGGIVRGLEDVTFAHSKPAALVYLDDRAWRFDGTFPSAQDIHNARPWNKPRKGAA